eukprot:SAG31_NODE_9932_length_1208_cov_2.251578_2_plen_50_part_01
MLAALRLRARSVAIVAVPTVHWQCRQARWTLAAVGLDGHRGKCGSAVGAF